MVNSRQLASKWQYPRRSRFISNMRKAATAWFQGKGLKLHPKYEYCLADRKDWKNNIILEEVAEYIEDIQKQRGDKGNGFALHDYVHHGLSSQAMLFNLIGPLIRRHDLEPLYEVLEQNKIKWSNLDTLPILEYEDRKVFNEDSGQPTSIDLVVGNPDKEGALFIECKFTESGFGGCSVFEQGDCPGQNPVGDLKECYLHHIGRLYWERLDNFEFLNGALLTNATCILASYYQFFREILFALYKGGTFVILSDNRSPTFSFGVRGLLPFLLKFVPSNYRNQIGQINVQDLVTTIEKSGNHDDWIAEFKNKYGM